MWQDITFTIANIIFVYALIPQIYKEFKNKRGYITFQTSLLTTMGMYALTIIYFTLGLPYSAIFAGIAGTLG